MNYLYHFYNELPCDDPYFTCGIILPDLLSNYSNRSGKKIKLFPSKLFTAGNINYDRINNGVRRHYASDKYFHGSDFFRQQTGIIESLIHKHIFQCFERRLFAFSHVFLELMLDRIILLKEKPVCDHFYALLCRVKDNEISDYIYANTSSPFSGEAAEFFERFCTFRYVYDYVSDTRLISLLQLINLRLGNNPFNNSDAESLKTVIHDYENILIHQKIPKFPSDL